jgi:nitroreductase
MRLAPSSFGLQPWHFIVAQDPALRALLSEASWRQPQVLECSHLVVLTSLKNVDVTFIDRYVASVSTQRGVALDSLAQYRESMVESLIEGPRHLGILEWSRRQAYIAMGFLLLAAAELRIDACPMEGLQPQAFDRILGLEQGPWGTVAIVTLGFRQAGGTDGRALKVRFGDAEVFETR